MNTITKAKQENWISTSFHFDTIVATPNKLIELLGEPTYDTNDGADKVNLEWELTLDDGTFFTLYDWKQYRELQPNGTYTFHIGAKDQDDSQKAHSAVQELLKTN